MDAEAMTKLMVIMAKNMEFDDLATDLRDKLNTFLSLPTDKRNDPENRSKLGIHCQLLLIGCMNEDEKKIIEDIERTAKGS